MPDEILELSRIIAQVAAILDFGHMPKTDVLKYGRFEFVTPKIPYSNSTILIKNAFNLLHILKGAPDYIVCILKLFY